MPILIYIFVTLSAIQLVYWIAIMRMIYIFKKTSSPPTPTSDGLSLVICARNETENLMALLPKLEAQNYPNFEIIVVDDRSADDQYDFLLATAKNPLYKRLRHIRINHTPDWISGKKFALTIGIKAAKNDIVVLTDADCMPNSDNWLELISEPLRLNRSIEFVAGYAPYNKQKRMLNILIRFETFFSGIQWIAAAFFKQPYMATGRNLAYRKSTFLANNGFQGHLDIVGGDDDLYVNKYANKTNFRFVANKNAWVYSVPKNNIADWFTQKRRHLSVSKYYKPQTIYLIGGFVLNYIGLIMATGFSVFYILKNPNFTNVFTIFCIFNLFAFLFMLNSQTIASKFFEEKFGFHRLFLLNLLFGAYYLIIGLFGHTARRIRWK